MTNFIKILRWLLFLPISLLCNWLVFYVVFYVLDMSTGRNAAPDSIISYFNHIAASGLSGAALVYSGVYIVPSYEKRVAIGYVVTTLILLILILTLPIFWPEFFRSLTNRELYSFLDNLTFVALNVGIFIMAWNIYQRKVVFEKKG